MTKPPHSVGDQQKPSGLEGFVTEDGIEVPPPSRPMGERRLARYYQEAADYLRARRDGVEPLPDVPLFMGPVEGLDLQPHPAQALEGLSQMGTISKEPTEVVEVEVEQTAQMALEEALLASAPEEPTGLLTTELPVAPHQLADEGDFIEGDLEALAEEEAVAEEAEAEEALEPADTEEEAPAEEAEAEEEAVAEEETTPEGPEGLEEAQAEEVEKQTVSDDHSETGELAQDGPVDEAEDLDPSAAELVDQNGVALGGRRNLDLPAPVRALEAQGLDLTELDAAVMQAESQLLGLKGQGGVDSDSSDESDVAASGQDKLAWHDQESSQVTLLQEGRVVKIHADPTALAATESEPELAQKSSSRSLGILLLLLLLMGLGAGLWFYFMG